MSTIEIRHLYKRYNEDKPNAFDALKDINLVIEDAQMVILKGVSGSGKSTLLNLIGGLGKPSEGEICVNGHNIAKLPDIAGSHFRHKEVGFIFQSFHLLEALSVYDNVQAPLSLLPLSTLQKEDKVLEAMRLANIAHKKEQTVAHLSGGEKQRCAIARALVMNPSIILADEPTANLDQENAQHFLESLKLFKALKKTVIVATHDSLFDGLDMVDRYIFMHDGKMI